MRNAHVSIPLVHLKGRGLDMDINATFNNETWSTNEVDDVDASHFITTSPNLKPDTSPSGGWSIGVARMGDLSTTTWKCEVYMGDGSGQCLNYALYANFITAEGSMIQLGDDSGLHGTGPNPTSFWSNDGTYMRIHTSSTAAGLVYKDGVTLYQQYNPASTFLEDTNGNVISCSQQPVAYCTDTVGRTVNFNYGSSLVSPSSLTYPDSSGTTQTVTFTWQSFRLDAPWANGGDCGAQSGTCSVTDDRYSINLITKITLPNNLAYSFEYVTLAPGVTTGQLAKLILPTGGYIRYTYPCSSGSACPSLTYALSPDQEPWAPATARIVSADGSSASEKTWSYVSGTVDSTYGQPFTVTDPLGNSQTSYFKWDLQCPPAETRTDMKNSTGTLLQQVINTAGSDGTAYTDPFPYAPSTVCNNPRVVATNKALSDTNQQSKVTYTFGAFGNVTDQYEYDWGSGAPGSLLRHVNYQYLHSSNGAYGDLTAHILDRLTSQLVYDGSGTLKAQTTTVYDGTTPTSTSNVVQHDYTNHSASNTLRGNPTQTSNWLNTSGGWLATNRVFNDVGSVLQTTDPMGNTTSFSYADNYYNYTPPQPTSAFVSQITRPTTNGVAHVHRLQYYFGSGLTAATCGENFSTGTACSFGLSGTQPDYASFTYDSQGRPLSIKRGDTGQTTVAYNEASLPISITGTVNIDASHNLVGTVVYDGLGRESQTQLNSDPIGVDFVDITYDALGRKASVSNPHRSTASSTDGVTQTQYDALSRVTQVTKQDGSISSVSYSGNCTTATDEANKSRKSCSDGLGRLTNVWEDPSGLNYETDYQYDVLGNFLRVDQKGSAPADNTKWRTRLFTYNSLSQLLTAYNPESGTISYVYDADGNMVSKTSPAPNQTGTATVTTTYGFDLLNRVTQKTYSDSTPTAYFLYDAGGGWGIAQTNTVGRLAEAWIGTPAAAAKASIFGYDNMGRTVMNNQCTPANCGVANWSLNYTYDLLGDMTSYTTSVGVTFTQAFDSAGRIMQLTSNMVGAQWPAALATVDPSIGYYPAGGLRKVTLGNGLTETAAFNVRLQPCRTNVNSSGSTLGNCTDAIPGGNVQDFGYAYGAVPLNNGNVVSMSTSGNQNFSRSYGYDALNRLLTMSAPGDSCSGLGWTYDAWGNRTDQSVTGGSCNSSHQPTTAQNRVLGGSYDAAGNMTNDGFHAYTYDAENRIIQVDGGSTASYVYDALGRRVRKTVGTAWTDYVYDLSGNVVTEYIGPQSTWATSYIYFGGQLVAEYKDATTYFVHKDHLGSTRLLSKMDRTLKDSMDYLPYGEQIAGNTSTSHKFTGKERDSESALDYFGARYYSSALGRWISPDWSAGPVPVPYADGADPQTLNLYSYVRNLPTTKVDADGHSDSMTRYWQCQGNSSPGCAAANHNTTPGEAVAQGAAMGLWFGGGLLAPAAGPLTRGLAALFLATAPKTMPIVVDTLEGLTPGRTGTLTISSTTRLTATEISTGVRLAEQTGARLVQSEHIGAEFVDAAGKTYDAMGGGKAFEHFGDGSKFLNSITNHLNKAVDFVAVDLKGASKDQVKAIKDFVGGLAKDQQNRIKYVQ